MGGIDMYGIDDLSKVNYFFKEKDRNGIAIIGQAKKWKNEVGLDTIDAFIKKYRDLKNGTHKIIKKLPQVFTPNIQDYFAIVITTSYFSKDAIESANGDDVELRDREQIIEELIKLSKIEVILSWFSLRGTKKKFDKKKFRDWISKLDYKLKDIQ